MEYGLKNGDEGVDTPDKRAGVIADYLHRTYAESQLSVVTVTNLENGDTCNISERANGDGFMVEFANRQGFVKAGGFAVNMNGALIEGGKPEDDERLWRYLQPFLTKKVADEQMKARGVALLGKLQTPRGRTEIYAGDKGRCTIIREENGWRVVFEMPPYIVQFVLDKQCIVVRRTIMPREEELPFSKNIWELLHDFRSNRQNATIAAIGKGIMSLLEKIGINR